MAQSSAASSVPKIFSPEVKRILAFGFFVSLFINVLYLVYPIFMIQVFDRVVPTRNLDTLWLLLIFAVTGLFVMFLLYLIRSRMFVRLSVLFDLALSERLVKASLAISRVTNRQIRDGALGHVAAVRSFISGDGIFVLYDAPWVPIFLTFIFFVHPLLGMVTLVGGMTMAMLALLTQRVSKQQLLASNLAMAQSRDEISQAMANDTLIEAMGMRPAVLARWRRHHFESLYQGAVASDRAGTILSVTKAVRQLVQVAIMAAAAYLIVQDLMNPGAMMAVFILSGRVLGAIEQSISNWRQFIGAREGYRQLLKLLETVPGERASLSLPEPVGDLMVSAVSYHPPGSQRLILRNVSFTLTAGTSLGVVGPSGAGKSTLMRVLVGVLPPAAGKVRLDGVDLTDWDKEEIGPHIGYLPQEVHLFDGTIAENIARLQAAPARSVIEAAKLAGVHDMILRMPSGYDTVLGPGGQALSGGQRQRIALARALFGRPRLLVLDEPNSNLDAEGEQALLQALRAMKAMGTTIIMVSHRVAALSFVDRILVLKDGGVHSFGPRQEAKAAPARADLRSPQSLPVEQKHG